MDFGQECHRNYIEPLSAHHISRYTMLLRLIKGGVNFGHVIKVSSVRFLHS